MKFLIFVISLLFLLPSSFSVLPDECALTLEFSYRYSNVVLTRVVTLAENELNFMGQMVDLTYSIEPRMEDNILNWTQKPTNGTGELILTYRIISEKFKLDDFSGTIDDIPEDVVEKFTGKSVLNVGNEGIDFIDPFNEKIAEKAKEIVGEDNNIYNASKKLYQWITDNIRYNNAAKIYPTSAIETLEKRSGDCDEQTALFLSMARSLSIPCFYMDGYVISGKGRCDSGHAWSGVFTRSEGVLTVFPVDTVYGEFAVKRSNKVFVDFDCGAEGYINNIYNDLKYWHNSQEVPEVEYTIRCSSYMCSDLSILYIFFKARRYGDF